MQQEKAILIILDGWGDGKKNDADLIHQAVTPNMDKFLKEQPHSKLKTHGENVGLPEGQMGNSEVGHMNLGAGRIVYQDLVKINKAIEDNSIADNQALRDAFDYAKQNNKSVHFLGLVSDGGVHSSDKHLYKLCDLTRKWDLDQVYIHALTDGRDTDPKSGLGFIKNLQKHLEKSNGKIASLVGRYYTMDRDKRWERIKKGYDLMVHGEGKKTHDLLEAIKESYDEGVTDEFIKPIVVVDDKDEPVATVKEGDVFICFNFRTDRLRQITVALTQKDFPDHNMHTLDLRYYTMTEYDDTFKNIRVIFEKVNPDQTIGEVLARHNKKQLRIAETEKYAHVTFFFSGGREEPFEGEQRILINSPKVATYDLQPEMSAYKVKDAIVEQLNSGTFDFICLNFANGDMVGHTGDKNAIIKAVEAVDKCVGEVMEAARKNGYAAIVTADHGNADNAVNDDGSPNTAHSMNPVPCILFSDQYGKINDGILADIAPTILKIMGLDRSEKMTGKVLVEK